MTRPDDSKLDKLLSIHHIGGRGGGMGGFLANQIPDNFKDSMRLVVYDADPECLDQIRERVGLDWAQTDVLPYFIGSSAGNIQFNIRYDPHISSAAELKDRYAQFYTGSGGVDYVYGDVFEKVRTIDIDTIPFDTLVYDRHYPKADFLSMDVCAASHDVYLGAQKCLSDDILAIVDNMSIPSIYKDTKVFPDSLKLLEQFDFDFVAFHDANHYAPDRLPVGQRGMRYTIMGDALFLKRFETILDAAASDNEKYLKLCKLSFISLCLGYIETGLLALRATQTLNPDKALRQRLKKLSYGRFLNDVEESINKMPNNFPPQFVEIFSAEKSKDRFRSSEQIQHAGSKGRIRDWLKCHPMLLRFVRFLRKDRGWSRSAKSIIRKSIMLADRRSTPFERVLKRYHLTRVGRLVRAQRLNDQLAQKIL